MMKGQNLLDIDALIDQHQNDLFHFCFSLTKSKVNAEDLFQDTWIKVVSKINQFNTSCDFKHWLFKIALNTYRDKYRKLKHESSYVANYRDNNEKEISLLNVKGKSYLPETEMLKKESKNQLKGLVNELPDKFRLPVVMFYYHELSLKEIAQLLKVPVGTVKSRLNKSKKLLKSKMEVSVDGCIRQNVI